MVDILPDLEVISKGQCFPMFWYERVADQSAQAGLSFDGQASDAKPDANGFVKRDGVTDVALANFRHHYSDESITKEAIFYYCYGVLHSPEYRTQYAADLKKELPRIPLAPDFWAFSKAGRELAHWHLNYETVEPYPLVQTGELDLGDTAHYQVQKMRFGKNGKAVDKTTIIVNSRLHLRGIPLEAYDYIVNGKSALEWVMERYQITVDKDSGIRNDPNAWSDDPRYIVDLVKRIVRTSVETVELVTSLPPLNETH